MFKKKYCKNCGEKINHKSNFCPECGVPINHNKKRDDYGMLGKNDIPNEFQELERVSNSLFSGLGGKFMNKMLNNTMKMLEKEMEKNAREVEKPNNFKKLNTQSHFELFINGKRINPENIKVSRAPLPIPGKKENKMQQRETPRNAFFSKNKKEQFMKFQKTEPKTELKRFSDKIIYRVFLPGVKLIEDVSIIQLESSIEIKAVSNSKKKSYSKMIPIGMKISDYSLENEILFLEIGE